MTLDWVRAAPPPNGLAPRAESKDGNSPQAVMSSGQAAATYRSAYNDNAAAPPPASTPSPAAANPNLHQPQQQPQPVQVNHQPPPPLQAPPPLQQQSLQQQPVQVQVIAPQQPPSSQPNNSIAQQYPLSASTPPLSIPASLSNLGQSDPASQTLHPLSSQRQESQQHTAHSGTGGGILAAPAPLNSASAQLSSGHLSSAPFSSAPLSSAPLSPTSNGIPRYLSSQPAPTPSNGLSHHIASSNAISVGSNGNPLGTPNNQYGSSSGLGGTNSLGPPTPGGGHPASAPQGHHSVHGGQRQQANTYAGVGTIPGLHSVTQPNMLHGLQTMSSFGSGWDNGFGYPGMPSMQSLMQNHRMDPIGHTAHHTSANAMSSASPLGPSLGAPLSASPFPNVGMLSGGITKPRKHRRRGDLSAALKGEDPHSLLMGLPNAKYDTSSLLLAPTGPTQNLPEADGVQFKYLHQLPEAKVRRLRDEKIKPIEELTFEDIKAYNRNQLRAYCFVYGIKRKKKAEMEKNMARYAALFHAGDPQYDICKFKPTQYIEGAIPRRKVPVTKEQKERAAGNTQELTKVINRRPQVSAYHSGYTAAYPFGHAVPGGQPPPLAGHSLAPPGMRLYEPPYPQHHLPTGQLAPPGGVQHDDVGHAPGEFGVPEPLHVSNQLLSLPNQMTEE